MKSHRLPSFFTLVPVFVLALAASSLPAQSAAVFEATATQREVPVGHRFQVTFTLRNAEARSFRTPDFKGFKVAGPAENMRGMTMVNGKSSVYQSWGFELEALRVGTFTIGPVSITTTDGKTLQTKPLAVRVVPARVVQVPRGADEDLFVTAECTPATAFVGQQVKFQVKVYTRVKVGAWELLNLPKLDDFLNREMKRFDRRPQSQTVRGNKYTVQTLHEITLFPQEAGEFKLGETQLRLEVEKAGAPMTIFGPALTAVLLKTAPVRLLVKPLPEPAPAGFSGVVGRYEARFSTDRDSLTTEDAVTFLLEIQGNGNARQFTAPRLTLPDGLETFDPKVREEEEFETTDELAHRQILEYVIMPKRPGAYNFRPEFVYFSPDSNRYVTLRPEQGIALVVAAGPNASQPPAADSTGLDLPDTPGGGDFWSQLGKSVLTPWFLGAVTTVLMGFIVFLLLQKRSPPPAPVAPVARPPASAADTRGAREWLANAQRRLVNDSPRLFFDELYKALGGWLAARLDVPAAALTPELLRERLAERRVPEARIAALLHVWRTCEQAVFAGQYNYLNMEIAWRQTEEVVQGLEQDLRRG